MPRPRKSKNKNKKKRQCCPGKKTKIKGNDTAQGRRKKK